MVRCFQNERKEALKMSGKITETCCVAVCRMPVSRAGKIRLFSAHR